MDRYFPSLLREQDFLGTKEAWEKLLNLLPGGVQHTLRTEFEEDIGKGSEHRWGRIRQEVCVCVCVCSWVDGYVRRKERMRDDSS